MAFKTWHCLKGSLTFLAFVADVIRFFQPTTTQAFLLLFVDLLDVISERSASGKGFITIAANKLFLVVSSSVILKTVRGFEPSQTHTTRVQSLVFNQVVVPKFGRAGEYLVAVFAEGLGVVDGVVICVLRRRWREVLLVVRALGSFYWQQLLGGVNRLKL